MSISEGSVIPEIVVSVNAAAAAAVAAAAAAAAVAAAAAAASAAAVAAAAAAASAAAVAAALVPAVAAGAASPPPPPPQAANENASKARSQTLDFKNLVTVDIFNALPNKTVERSNIRLILQKSKIIKLWKLINFHKRDYQLIMKDR
jgi:hypothetical protein